jgi:hypothetical protein
MAELNNETENFNSQLDQAEKKKVNLKTEYLKLLNLRIKKKKKNEENLQGLWGTINRPIPCMIRIKEGKDGETESESIFKEILGEIFPNLRKEAT